jgi:hypothetical protein
MELVTVIDSVDYEDSVPVLVNILPTDSLVGGDWPPVVMLDEFLSQASIEFAVDVP